MRWKIKNLLVNTFIKSSHLDYIEIISKNTKTALSNNNVKYIVIYIN